MTYKTGHEVLSKEEEQILIGNVQAKVKGWQFDLDKLVNCNVDLVWFIARKSGALKRFPDRQEDIFQNGMIGLLKGIEKWDPIVGGKLSTYASVWIYQCITRAIRNGAMESCIPYPVHHSKVVSQLWRVGRHSEITMENVYKLYLEDCETNDIVAQFKEKQVKASYEHMCSVSFCGDDAIGDDDNNLSFFDTLVSNEPNPMEILQEQSAKNKVREMLLFLDERERTILSLRFGLDSNKLTLDEIGKQYCVCRERIRQIEAEALSKLKNRFHFDGIEKIKDIF